MSICNLKFGKLAVVLVLVVGSATASEPPPQKPVAQGNLVIYDKRKDNGDWPVNCSIPFERTVTNFPDGDDGCTNDEAYGFKINNAESAAIVWFDDNGKCEGGGNFRFKLRTIKNPTSMTEVMPLDALDQYSAGQVVTPGLQLIEKNVDGQIHGKLSCVEITMSPLP
ncbi:hypothetical protein [uncultured Pseudomonas sp.]|uniref:hypothetical protein n=1 Tax=uncultured Pseudomonas sp. TaxID=114707 RepID=UPI0026015308|nr:hypothetical protein [uncultured Pseudomonas sp.]